MRVQSINATPLATHTLCQVVKLVTMLSSPSSPLPRGARHRFCLTGRLPAAAYFLGLSLTPASMCSSPESPLPGPNRHQVWGASAAIICERCVNASPLIIPLLICCRCKFLGCWVTETIFSSLDSLTRRMSKGCLFLVPFTIGYGGGRCGVVCL